MTCSTAIFIFIGLAFYSNVNCQSPSSDPSASIMDKISDIANTPGLNETALQQVENIKDKIKDKCEKNGGSFDKLLTAKDDLEICMKGLIDVNLLQIEIENAKPHGDLDSVFQRYCMKNVTFLKCMTDFISVAEPCLETTEQTNLRALPNVTESFLNFICHKEGDRIALFIATQGPECIQSKQSAIQNCLNATFGDDIPAISANGTTPTLESLPLFEFSIPQCNKMAKLQDCIVKELEKCSDPTPGNMADALFTFVKNATPCHDVLQGRVDAVIADNSQLTRSSASTLMCAYSIVLVLATVIFKYL